MIAGPNKKPTNADTGDVVDPTDPAQWSSFHEAQAAASAKPGWLPGFCLSLAAGFTVIDLDHSIDESGTISPEAQTIIDRFRANAYIERSRSGRGVHIWVRASLPPNSRRKLPNMNIECYNCLRFVVCTGDVVSSTALVDRTIALELWHQATFPPPSTAPDRFTTLVVPSLADEELTARCLRSERFRALHERGDLGAYGGDDSSADLAYVNLVRLNGGQPSQADALYRSSAIYRPKWDSRRGENTYGSITLAKGYDGTIAPSPRADPHLAVSLPPALAPEANGATNWEARALAAEQQLARSQEREARCAADKARFEARAIAAEHHVERLSALVSQTASVMRNPNLKAERATAVVLAHQFANRESANDPGDDGLYPIPLARIAEAGGSSEDSASKHIATLAEAGVLRKSLRWDPAAVNPETGEVTGGRTRQYIGPVGSALDFVQACATLAPKRVRRDGTPQTNWGGHRTVCPDHPDAGSVLRWSLQCKACNRILDSGTGADPHLADTLTERRDDVVLSAGAEPHLAVSIADQCGKDVLRDRTDTICTNESTHTAEPVPFTRPVGAHVWLAP